MRHCRFRRRERGGYINSDAWNFWLSEKMASMNRDELKAEIEKDVDFCCGEGNEGREAKVVVGATVPLDVDMLVNTVPCGRAKILADASGYPSGKVKTTYCTVAIPAGALHDGINNVELFNHGEKTIKGSELVWMEIAVQQ